MFVIFQPATVPPLNHRRHLAASRLSLPSIKAEDAQSPPGRILVISSRHSMMFTASGILGGPDDEVDVSPSEHPEFNCDELTFIFIMNYQLCPIPFDTFFSPRFAVTPCSLISCLPLKTIILVSSRIATNQTTGFFHFDAIWCLVPTENAYSTLMLVHCFAEYQDNKIQDG